MPSLLGSYLNFQSFFLASSLLSLAFPAPIPTYPVKPPGISSSWVIILLVGKFPSIPLFDASMVEQRGGYCYYGGKQFVTSKVSNSRQEVLAEVRDNNTRLVRLAWHVSCNAFPHIETNRTGKMQPM